MNIRDLRIIDVDSHLTEPHDLWTKNAPAEYVDRVPRVVDVDGIPMWSIDGVTLSRASASGVIRPDGEKQAGVEFLEWAIEDVHPGAYDMAARLAVLDDLDIYAQILYPNVAGFGAQKFGLVEDPVLRRLCATLYNDAMVEIQEESNGRLLPMGLMPWWDVEGSIAEAERCAANGLRGVNLCSDPQSRGAAELWEPEWDPFWAVCAERELPVNFHIGASDTSMSWFGTSPWPKLDEDRKIAIGSAMMYLSNARIIANLVFSGVLERFPTVKFVSVESGIGWMPFFLESLDYQLYETAPSAVAELSMLPSEYFKRQVYGCFWFEARQLQSVIDALGVTQVLFETDFPHPTCLYPDPVSWVDKALAEVDDHTKQRVLQDNAAELYKIPLPVAAS